MTRDELTLFFPHPKVLIVDDDREFAELAAEMVRQAGAEVKVAFDGMGALAAVKGFNPDLVISDLSMPILRGDVLLSEMRKAGLKKPFILLTGLADAKEVNSALHNGAFDYLVKPVSSEILLSAIKKALRSEYQRLIMDLEFDLVYQELSKLDPSRSVAMWKEQIHKRAAAEVKLQREK